jgi:hypothetical protein
MPIYNYSIPLFIIHYKFGGCAAMDCPSTSKRTGPHGRMLEWIIGKIVILTIFYMNEKFGFAHICGHFLATIAIGGHIPSTGNRL